MIFKLVERLEDLQPGDIVRHRVAGDKSYVVTANYGDRITAVHTVDITNPAEWVVLKNSEAPRRYLDKLLTIRETAYNLGYAIAVYGSRQQKLNLIAVPWVQQAVSANLLALAVRTAVNGVLMKEGKADENSTIMPHGRLFWSIRAGNGLYIDLTVMTEGASAG